MKVPPLYRRMMASMMVIIVCFAMVPAQPTPAQSQNRLPMFRLTKVTAGDTTTQQLGGLLEGIGRNAPAQRDEYLGKSRFFRLNEGGRSVLTQYAASGGFFAYDIDGIGRETPAGSINIEEAKRLACLFLRNNNFIDQNGILIGNGQSNYPVQTQATPGDCSSTKDFARATRIRAAQTTATGAGTAQVTDVGVVVEVPIGFNSGQFLPIGGAGGHVSLLFTTTETGVLGDSIDSTIPGLAAAAMPFYGRSLEFLRDVPVRDLRQVRSEVETQVRASYPGATVNVPLPTLIYTVDDAAVEQTILEPEAAFENIAITLPGGEEIVLRSFTVPLAEESTGGFVPTVSITAPTNGSVFNTANPVNLVGTIANGTPPYTYQWLLGDETPLGDPATLNTPGQVSRSVTLPATARETTPDLVTVILRVTDSNGVQREATISLTPFFQFVHLPLIQRPGTSPAQTGELAQTTSTAYTFGIEGIWDYPPAGSGGSDLPGVVPDVNGFRTGMLSIEYTQRFFWKNSNAWERDWRDCSLGGIDCTLGVDRADFVYFAGHGGPGGISMASNKDSPWFSGNQARYQTLRWIGFASCQTLRVQGYTSPNEPIRRWFNAFQGAHMLLGFNSNMADVAFGGQFVDNMRLPTFFGIEFPWAQLTIAQAWVKTAFDMNAGKPAYIYARSSTVNPLNNKLPKPGSSIPPRPTPVTSYHWVWWEF